MESAIPQHLMRERTQPVGLATALPLLCGPVRALVTRVAMAYFGVQYRSEGEPPAIIRTALADLTAASTTADGPSQVDRARYVDEADYHTVVSIAYWDDLTRHERWFAAARQRWLGDQHTCTEAGFFIEAVRPSTSRFETLFSNDRIEGVAHSPTPQR